MKIKTVPFLPLRELSECSFPSTSGNLKSSIIVPMAGGAGRSFELRPLPATAANPMTTRDARKIGRPYFFMLEKLLSKMIGFVNAKISSQKLDVASGRRLPPGIRHNEDSCPPTCYPGNYYDRQYARRHCGRKQTILTKMMNNEGL